MQIKDIISASELSERDHWFYSGSFHSRVQFGPLCFATCACGLPIALQCFGLWLFVLVRRGNILIRGSIVVILCRWSWIREGTVEHLLGHRCLCGVKQTAKHNAYKLYTFLSLQAGEIYQNTSGWRRQPLNVVLGESKATQTGCTVLPLMSKKESL